MNSLTYAVSWSSGKDSCLSLWKSISQGMEVGYLLNTYWQVSDRGAWHGIRVDLIKEQARSLGIPVLQKAIGTDDYADRFVEALTELKGKGVEGVIFGDIEPLENRGWCEKVCERAGLSSHFPLWRMDHRKVTEDFINAGFKAIVVSVDSRVLGKEDLGRELDREWMDHIEELRKENPSLSHAGENGEFHTFVYDGPLFKSKVPVKLGERSLRKGYWSLDLLPGGER